MSVDGLLASREPLGVVRELRTAFAGPKVRATRRRTASPPPAPRAAADPAPPEPRPAADPPALRCMPPPAPLAMPRQDLSAAPEADAPAGAREGGGGRARLLLALGAGVGLLQGAGLAYVLGKDGIINGWEAVVVLLSSLLGAWMGFGFMSASAGFVVGFRARREAPPAAAAGGAVGEGRTAVLLPIYNEDPGLILAAVQSMAEDMAAAGLAERCDIFILSDTRQPELFTAEAVGVLRVRARLPAGPQVYYRRRALNTDRKAGNIGEWVERHGGAYAYMLVLDADSLMTGRTIGDLIAHMDADPGLGLLQTAPSIVNASTPFARVQQFANRLYGPVFARGQEWWSGSEGNYWGHNAIIRTAAFAACARLPHLSGPRPFGGHIMSHDFVEAALLRRRGWAVRTITALPGSYEESPPTLLDTAVRDRRWCQGNLQHIRVLGAAGLHWVSNLHLLCGVFAYVAPLLWFFLLVIGAVVWPAEQVVRGSFSSRLMVGLFATSLALLAAPKLMALVLALRDRELRRGFGGASLLAMGVAAETIVSILITPVMMVMQSVAVVEVLLGRDSGWSAQHREGAELTGRAAWRAHGGHVVLGALGAIGAFFVNKQFLVWTSPVFLSLTLSALLSLHSSKAFGERPRRGLGLLFQTPEEVAPPRVLLRSRALRRAYAGEAEIRRRIELLMRRPVAIYEMARAAPAAAAPAAGELPMVA
jgi:membrane glycosyltransferase